MELKSFIFIVILFCMLSCSKDRILNEDINNENNNANIELRTSYDSQIARVHGSTGTLGWANSDYFKVIIMPPIDHNTIKFKVVKVDFRDVYNYINTEAYIVIQGYFRPLLPRSSANIYYPYPDKLDSFGFIDGERIVNIERVDGSDNSKYNEIYLELRASRGTFVNWETYKRPSHGNVPPYDINSVYVNYVCELCDFSELALISKSDFNNPTFKKFSRKYCLSCKSNSMKIKGESL